MQKLLGAYDLSKSSVYVINDTIAICSVHYKVIFINHLNLCIHSAYLLMFTYKILPMSQKVRIHASRMFKKIACFNINQI